jgi:hypothetical protein
VNVSRMPVCEHSSCAVITEKLIKGLHAGLRCPGHTLVLEWLGALTGLCHWTVGCERSHHTPMSVRLVVLAFVLVACSASASIQDENAKTPTSPWREWDVNAANGDSIGGFSDRVSYEPGDAVRFTIVTDASSIAGQIYRLGWYGGDGARKVGDAVVTAKLPLRQPHVEGKACDLCTSSASWTIPEDAANGVYLARFHRGDDVHLTSTEQHVPVDPNHSPDELARALLRGRKDFAHAAHFGEHNATHIIFVVRSTLRPAEGSIVYRVADALWATTATRGSQRTFTYNNPQASRANEDINFFAIDYPAIRFFERAGITVTYVSTGDVEESGSVANLMGGSKVFACSGFDRSWSRSLRDLLREMPAQGVHRLLLGVGDAPRTLNFTTKDNRNFVESDITDDDAESTTGVVFTHVSWAAEPLIIPAEVNSHALWANTRFAGAAHSARTMRDLAGRALGTIATEPTVAVRLTRTTFDWTYRRVGDVLRHESDENLVHSVLAYRDRASHALTFVAASSSFVTGLDSLRDISAAPKTTPFGAIPGRIHLDRHPARAEVAVQQLVVNVLGFMGVTGPIPVPGLVAAGAVPENDAIHRPDCVIEATEVVEDGSIRVTVTATDRHRPIVGVKVGVPHAVHYALSPVADTTHHTRKFEGVIRLDTHGGDAAHEALQCVAINDALYSNPVPGGRRPDPIRPPAPPLMPSFSAGGDL